jgi:RWD domain
MNEELENEIEAINSIYEADTLTPTDDPNLHILRLPHQNISLRLGFPRNYPEVPPEVLGSETSGGHKGDATRVVDIVRQEILAVFRPGEVVIFEVLERIGQRSRHEEDDHCCSDDGDSHDLASVGSLEEEYRTEEYRSKGPATAATNMLFRALIKTHHMTSRKKIATITKSAATNQLAVLLKTGGPPGVMLAEGEESGVKAWVDEVRRLRYKDYQLLVHPVVVEKEVKQHSKGAAKNADGDGLTAIVGRGNTQEVEKLRDFGAVLKKDDEGLWRWWRHGMGFTGDEG